MKKLSDKADAPKTEHTFIFGKENYLLMAIGVVVLFIGFFLMAGKEDIFSSTKLTVAPIIVLIGFGIELVAIMRKPKNQE